MARLAAMLALAACASTEPVRLPDGTSVSEARSQYPSADYSLIAANEGGNVALYVEEAR